MLRVAGVCAILLAIGGCASSTRAVIAYDKASTSLELVRPDQPDLPQRLYGGASSLVLSNLASSPSEQRVAEACGLKPPSPTERASLGESILGVFVGPLINLAFDAINEKLQNEIKEYSAAYEASSTVNIYLPPGPNEEILESPYRCLRFVRTYSEGVQTADSKPQIAADFIASLSINDRNDAFEVQPLRLYVARTTAKTSDPNGTYGFAIGLTANSVWRSGHSGSSEKVFEQVLWSGEISVPAEEPLIVYFDLDIVKRSTIPIIPYSIPSATGMPRGFATFVLRVAETGTPSASLEKFAALFESAKGDLADLLAESVNARLGFSDD